MTIWECCAAGMTGKQAAAAMGVSYDCALHRAKARGLTLRKDHGTAAWQARKLADPEFAAARAERAAEQLRQQHAAGKIDRRRHHLRGLTEAQLVDYHSMRRKARMSKAEALAALGVKP